MTISNSDIERLECIANNSGVQEMTLFDDALGPIPISLEIDKAISALREQQAEIERLLDYPIPTDLKYTSLRENFTVQKMCNDFHSNSPTSP